MKQRFITLALINLTYLTLNAQPYQSLFYPDTTRWSVTEYIHDLDYTDEFSTYSDTLIDNVSHKTLYVANGCYPNIMYPNSYLREDTLTGRVWYKIMINNEWKEFLIMDLSLSLKDTFLFYTDLFWNKADTLVVDTVYYDDAGRKVVGCNGKYTWRQHKIMFIEGIGPSSGFCSLNIFPSEMGLRCKFHNREHVYTLKTDLEEYGCYSYCGVSSLQTELGPFYKISKVSSGCVNIFINDPKKDICLDVYNLHGQIIKSQKMFFGDNPIWFETRGIFIFLLNDEKNTASVKISL